MNLPKPVAAYFAADVCPECFAPDAVVRDEGKTHQGRAAIQQWQEASAQAYQATNEPVSAESKDGKLIVTSRVSGNFPGSPVNLAFAFRVVEDQIVELEIQ
jgi:hypothetical protein